MIRKARPRDTIAWRLALTVLLAVAMTILLVRLFTIFGGAWGREPLERSGLLEEGGAIARAVQAAPPDLRPTLAEATSTAQFQVQWFAPDSRAASILKQVKPGLNQHTEIRNYFRTFDRTLLVFTPHGIQAPALGDAPEWAPPNRVYRLAVKFADNSWLVFTASRNLWGPAPWIRAIILGFALSLSIAIVSAITSRRIVGPIERLAEGVRHFQINPQAPPIQETGPQELRKVIAAFNAMQEQIRKFIEHRTAMVAAISHDLRTPLTRMRLRGEFIDDELQRAKLFRDVDEMRTMIDGALEFFREDANQEPTTPFDLAGVLNTIVNDFADQGIDLGYSGPAHAVFLGRPFAIKRAFTNLVENAIKYATPPELQLTVDGRQLRVLCLDHGPGLPAEALDRVFTPFFRVEGSRNPATGGVGLGLAAARGIIRGHGGDIHLQNRPEGGLQAEVILPRV